MDVPAIERRQTRAQAVSFAGRAVILRAIRGVGNVLNGPKRHPVDAASRQDAVVARCESLLYTSSLPAELLLQAGKVQNLRVAVRCLDGVVIPANEIFSFWRQIPRPVRRHGFVPGRELREGCIIPNIGGGLCQLSNALYDCALKAGFEIVERHAHTRVIPGSLAEQGRDATIFWNYVDLRFRSARAFRIAAWLTEHHLVVEFHSESPVAVEEPAPKRTSDERSVEVESCETCGMKSCFRHIGGPGAREITAWLVDAWWPEFDAYVREHRSPEDWLFVPLDGTRYKLRNYRWQTNGFTKVRQAPAEVLVRSVVSRRLAAQGARRQRALLSFDERLAAKYARDIPVLARHLVVSQNLLPFLWRSGVLGGRSFDVLMTRLPALELHGALDRARALYPDSPTIADFRVDARFMEDEQAALHAAEHWISPHSGIAALNPQRTIKLNWSVPEVGASPCGQMERTVYFPASTLARKGAYEVREAARRLGLRVVLGGPCIEASDFWNGVETVEQSSVCPVVLPAWVEHQPRRLLAAAAAGIPVLASHACGLKGVRNVMEAPAGDPDGLVRALERLFLEEKRTHAEPRSFAEKEE